MLNYTALNEYALLDKYILLNISPNKYVLLNSLLNKYAVLNKYTLPIECDLLNIHC